ncbi:hypothetical protein LMG28727_07263 [Paraburkholderia kirstenboschensis]|nr:hypothetical protein LMG28727_07263 [Paraburkholderia kirstenboschensis]
MADSVSPDDKSSLRDGLCIQPRPISQLGALTHSQWRVESTSALTPNHLCRRYDLSRPPRNGSTLVGRIDRNMPALMHSIVRMPVKLIIDS